MKRVAIVAHKYLPQPDDDLVSYLNKKGDYEIFHIKHSFPEARDRKSIIDIYQKGRKVKVVKSADFILVPEPLIYLKELFLTLKWIIFSGKRFDTYIGMDGLCTFFGMILRTLGICKRVIYWNIDFVPLNRFKAGWKNFFYHKINSFSCKHADEFWDLSPRMAEGRKKYLGIGKKDYKSYRVVPYGVWVDRIKKIPYEKCEKNTLVFMGHLMPKQGVDMVISKIPNMVKRYPNFSFKIIGGGRYSGNLVKLAKKMSVMKNCLFLGRINTKRMEREIAKSAVAIAPYLGLKDSYTFYADPGKVKTYLACGVPVLLTGLPWNAKEIQRNRCGLIIRDDGKDIVEKLATIMNPSKNGEFRQNALEYSRRFDYNTIFSQLGF
jgi:glycosyltransferase involved in cell wall biosynthesis